MANRSSGVKRAPRTIAVDFGTTTTLVAEMVDGVPEVKPIGAAGSLIPSLVEAHDGEVLVGDEADYKLAEWSIKTDITDARRCEVEGRSTDDLIAALIREALRLADITPEKGDVIRLGCPSSWDRDRRERLAEIATQAGIAVPLSNIVDEAVAAGVAWARQEERKGSIRSGNLLVVDLGGGTVDVTLLSINPPWPWLEDGLYVRAIAALGSGGNAAEVEGRRRANCEQIGEAPLGEPLGGDALDKMIVQSLPQLPPDWPETVKHYEVRRARERLSDPSIGKTQVGDSSVELDRKMVDGFINHMLTRVLEELIKKVFRDAVLRYASLDDFLRGEEYASAERKRRDDNLVWYPSGDDAKRLPFPTWPYSGEEGIDAVLVTGGLALTPAVTDFFKNVFSDAEFVELDAQTQESVVLGLLQADDESVWTSLALPSLDIGFEDDLIFRGFTPLFSRERVLRGEMALGFEWELPDARPEPCRLSVTLPGSAVPAPLKKQTGKPKDGEEPWGDKFWREVEHIEVPAGGPHRPRLKFYAFGMILLTDGFERLHWYTTEMSNPYNPVTSVGSGPWHGGTPGEPG